MFFAIASEAAKGYPRLYSTSFESINPEHWNTQGKLMGDEAIDEIRPLSVTADGELMLLTYPTDPSRGEVSSKFRISGNFDFQVDFFFKLNTIYREMDQNAFIAVRESVDAGTKASEVIFQLYRMRGFRPGALVSYLKKAGGYVKGRAQKVSSFTGMVRFVRSGGNVTLLIQTENDLDWIEFGKFEFSSNDVHVVFGAGNFMSTPQGIKPKGKVMVIYDNFWIQGAEGLSH